MRWKRFCSVDGYTQTTCPAEPFSLEAPRCPGPPRRKLAVQGSGISIAAASFGRGVLVLEPWAEQEILDFDRDRLEVTVRPSITLSRLYRFLISRGCYLPASPSHPAASVGGCIGANVHGQNHFRDGCFHNNIRALKLYHPTHGVITVSEREHRELLALTAGGFGLTGVILEATLRVRRTHTNVLYVATRKFRSLLEAYQILMDARSDYDFFHGWADLSDLGRRGMKGFIALAKFAESPGFKPEDPRCDDPTRWRGRRPLNLFGTPLMKAIGRIYYLLNTTFARRRTTLCNFIHPCRKRMFYFNMMGKRGVVEHQVLIPHDTVESYLAGFHRLLSAARPIVPLCHMKLFHGARRFLNFDGEGYCLAIHLQNTPRNLRLLRRLDQLALSHGCITNLVKDSRAPASVVRKQYGPEFDRFFGELRRYDRRLLFGNALSERLADA